MANLAISANQGNITISCDVWDWTSLVVNGTQYTSFPATAINASPVMFTANYNPGSVTQIQWPMIINAQDDSTGMTWVAVVQASSDGVGGVNLVGSVLYFESCANGVSGSTGLQFNESGLTGTFTCSVGE